jgi:flagellar hook assembly protein FlgD
MIFDGSGNLVLGGTVGQTVVGVGGYEPGALDIYHGFWYLPSVSSSVNDQLNAVAGERALWNSPNPFASQTTIHFDIPQQSAVKIRVYDMEGKLVSTVADARYLKGSHEVAWDARDEEGNHVATGYYYYTLDAQPSNGSGTPITRQAKMLVMK